MPIRNNIILPLKIENKISAIVRALMKSPEMIFCDEPTGALDYKNSQSFMHTLQKMNEQGMALIVITHDPMVAAYAKEVYFMKDILLNVNRKYERS